MKQKFDLSLWLQDKSRKICTRDGRPVRIVCHDVKGDYPVIGLIDDVTDTDIISSGEFPCFYKSNGVSSMESNFDLFFADEEKLNTIIDELKSYLKNSPKEQIEKDWKEIQDWYAQHFTNKKHNEEEELTEFEKTIYQHICTIVTACDGEVYGDKELKPIVKGIAKELLDLTRKELEKENSEFKPKFTYNEKDYSKLANKLIEFRNNTPLCSVSYRDGEGRKVILHYEKEIIELVKKEILKDLPKWKKVKENRCLPNYAAIMNKDGEISHSDIICKGEYFIMLQSLELLPKEE